MKKKKLFLLIFLIILLFFIYFNIKNFIILKDIYNKNLLLDFNNFYYEELNTSTDFSNTIKVYAKDNIYLSCIHSTFQKENDFYEIQWTNSTTNESIIFNKSKETNNEWKQSSTKITIDNYKSLVSTSYITNSSFINVFISNLFNNIKLDENNTYLIKVNGYDCYLDNSTYQCKKIVSKKYNNTYIEMSLQENIITENIIEPTLENITQNEFKYFDK